MSGVRRSAPVLAALAIAVGPASARAQHPVDHGSHGANRVVMRHASFAPARLPVLVGEPVRWVNGSAREHTVSSTSGLFESGRVGPGRGFGHTFATPGSFAYVCRIHPSMSGIVDAARLLLHPVAPVVRGEPFELGGRGVPGPGPVTIERDAGAGFAAVAQVARAADGSFAARLQAGGSATYRAVSGADASPPVHVEVADRRTVTVTTARARKRRVVRVVVSPVLPGGTVHLQRPLRERFGWWTVARRAVSATGRARFTLRRGVKGRFRVMLTKPDGETPVAVSRTLRLRG